MKKTMFVRFSVVKEDKAFGYIATVVFAALFLFAGGSYALPKLPSIDIAGLDAGQAWTCIEAEFFDPNDTTWGEARWSYYYEDIGFSNFNTPNPREVNIWFGSPNWELGIVNYDVYLPAPMDSTTRLYVRCAAGDSGDYTGYVDIDSTQVAEYTLPGYSNTYGWPPQSWVSPSVGALSAGAHQVDLMRGVDAYVNMDCFYIVEGDMTLGDYDYHYYIDAPWESLYGGEKKKLFDPPNPVDMGAYIIQAASVTPTITVTGATSYNCYLNGAAYTPGTAITEPGVYALEVYAFDTASADHVFSHSGVNFLLNPPASPIFYVDAGLTNTTIGGNAPEQDVNFTFDSDSGTDGLWYYNKKGTTLASNGYLWESDKAQATDSETTAPLIVSMTLSQPGVYRLYGLAEMANAPWDCAFSIGSDGPYKIANQANSYYEGEYSVRDLPVLTGGGSNIGKYMGLFTIGEVVTTTANEEIQVYVQGLDSGVGSVDQRTAFDGLAYEHWEKPYYPAPENGQTEVDPAVTPTLGWYTADVDNVTGHYLYINDEPDMTGVTPITVSDLTDPIEQAFTLAADAVYYWRVDTSISGSGPTDLATITGEVWSFETIITIPVITDQPKDAGGFIDDTVSFSVTATSPSPLHYTWYKSNDPNVDATDTVVGGDSDTCQVTITAADEAYYYCKVTNDTPTAVYTQFAELAIGRLLAHYKFEQDPNDYTGGRHGTVVDLSGNPVAADYVTGIDPNTVSPYGIDLTGTDKLVELSTIAYPNAGLASGLRQGTITAWVKTSTVTNYDYMMSNWNVGSNTGLSFTIFDSDGTNGIRFYKRQEGGSYMAFDGRPDGFDLHDNQWHMIAVTHQMQGLCRLYLDGIEVGYGSANLVGDQLADWEYPILIGSSRDSADRTVKVNLLESNLDELRVYNYMLSDTEIAALYLEGPAEFVCVDNLYGAGVDFNDDCKVNLADFETVAGAWLNTTDLDDLADLASAWLSCGLYPEEACD